MGGEQMTVRVRVIPCLDVADGRVVKGVNFVDLRDAGDPVEAARAYDAAGAAELCFLAISASHEGRSEEHTSELQSLMRISYAVFCLKKKNKNLYTHINIIKI